VFEHPHRHHEVELGVQGGGLSVHDQETGSWHPLLGSPDRLQRDINARQSLPTDLGQGREVLAGATADVQDGSHAEATDRSREHALQMAVDGPDRLNVAPGASPQLIEVKSTRDLVGHDRSFHRSRGIVLGRVR
jgi:hypothetical protein